MDLRKTILLLAVCLSTAVPAAAQKTDTTIIFAPSNGDLLQRTTYRPMMNAWGFDLIISNSGFGAGAFFRHEFSDVLSGTVSLSLNEVKDESEIERYTYYGSSYILGKRNRLVHLPLHASVQYRLFDEEITDSFRPYVTAGLGPSMLFVSPYNREVTTTIAGVDYTQLEQVDFFESLKYGKAHFTLGGYIGAGALFGIDKGTLTGISLRYYFIPFPNGIQLMDFGPPVKEFGGFYITINFGSFY